MKTSWFIHKHLWPSLNWCLIYVHIMSQLMCTWSQQKHSELHVSVPEASVIITVLFLHLYVSCFAIFDIRCSSCCLYDNISVCVSTTGSRWQRVLLITLNLCTPVKTHEWWHSEPKLALQAESPSYQGSDLMFQSGLPVKQITFIGNLCTISLEKMLMS